MPYKDEEARKEYMRNWSRKRRERNRDEVREFKVQNGCTDCGYNLHHAALEFDHTDDKHANVANLLSDTKRLWEEIAKCDVVCSNCHSIRTYNRTQMVL